MPYFVNDQMFPNMSFIIYISNSAEGNKKSLHLEINSIYFHTHAVNAVFEKRHCADFISAFVAFRKEISFSTSERASCS